jgi:predicted dithiol-disulfide oxidoreductase (DUF899 family)
MANDTSQSRIPNETADYRKARDGLLRAEVELRRKVEEVAALRRLLPLGGEARQDYVFHSVPAGDEVRLSQLFEDGHDTLILYSFMFSAEMEHPCPMCTSFLDSLEGASPHVTSRVSLGVVAKSPPPRIAEHAKSRGWRNLRLLSSASNSYNRDYLGEGENGAQWPMINVFVRDATAVRHFWASELFLADKEEGMHPRHVDMNWPLWNLFDLTPGGRGDNWLPALVYDWRRRDPTRHACKLGRMHVPQISTL